jgi:hypothetical protein
MPTLARQPVLYPNLHRCFVVLASLDVLITAAVLKAGGEEINPIAASVINSGAHTGMTFFKFATVAFVLVACEWIGRSSSTTTGRRLAATAVLANVFAITVGGTQLALFLIDPTW